MNICAYVQVCPGAAAKIFSTFFQKGIDKSFSVWYNIYVRKRKNEVINMEWFEFSLNGFLIAFIVLNVVNVVIQTIKSIATVSWGKWGASITNAVAYGLYTIVVVYMNADGLGLFWKALIIALANLIGVYVVKLVEEKKRKVKLWKVEATIHSQGIEPNNDDCIIELRENNISFNYIDANKYIILNCYCETQEESAKVKTILNKYKAKYFVSETKTL